MRLFAASFSLIQWRCLVYCVALLQNLRHSLYSSYILPSSSLSLPSKQLHSKTANRNWNWYSARPKLLNFAETFIFGDKAEKERELLERISKVDPSSSPIDLLISISLCVIFLSVLHNLRDLPLLIPCSPNVAVNPKFGRFYIICVTWYASLIWVMAGQNVSTCILWMTPSLVSCPGPKRFGPAESTQKWRMIARASFPNDNLQARAMLLHYVDRV